MDSIYLGKTRENVFKFFTELQIRRDEVNSLNSQLVSVVNTKNEQHEQIQFQKQEIQELKINLDAAKQAIVHQNEIKGEQYEASNDPILSAENRALAKQLEHAKIEINDLNKNREQIMIEIESLRTENRQLRQENHGFQGYLKEIQGQVKKLDNEQKLGKELMRSTREQLLSATIQIKTLKDQIFDLENRNHALLRENSKLLVQVLPQQMHVNNDGFNYRLNEELRGTIDRLKEELVRARDDRKELERVLVEYSKTNEYLTLELNNKDKSM